MEGEKENARVIKVTKKLEETKSAAALVTQMEIRMYEAGRHTG